MSVSRSADHQRMSEIADGLPTKSEKIRQLSKAGFQKADIGRFLGVRYQFVYNVLTAAEARAARDEPLSEPADLPDSSWRWTKLETGGRLALPTAFLEALELSEGEDVQIRLVGERIEILTRREALRSLQEDVRHCVPADRSLVEELIAERRLEAADEKPDG